SGGPEEGPVPVRAGRLVLGGLCQELGELAIGERSHDPNAWPGEPPGTNRRDGPGTSLEGRAAVPASVPDVARPTPGEPTSASEDAPVLAAPSGVGGRPDRVRLDGGDHVRRPGGRLRPLIYGDRRSERASPP